MVDLNDDGIIAADEYRFNCITKFAIEDIEVVDEAFNNLLNVSKMFELFCIHIYVDNIKKKSDVIVLNNV